MIFQMAIASLTPCFGVLFGDYLTTQNVSSTNIAWILNVHIFLLYFCSMFVGPICRHYSWRLVGCIFSLVVSMAFVVMAIFTSPIVIFLMFSLVVGKLL